MASNFLKENQNYLLHSQTYYFISKINLFYNTNIISFQFIIKKILIYIIVLDYIHTVFLSLFLFFSIISNDLDYKLNS